MTSWRPLKLLTLALMVGMAPAPAENATGYHLLSVEEATKHLSNPSVRRMHLERVQRMRIPQRTSGLYAIKKVPEQPFATTPVFYMFDQDAAGLLGSL